jgi:hypothetical protein
MCEFIEKLFIEQIKPEELNIQIDEDEVFKHYEKDKDELLILIGRLKAENYKLTQRLVGLDIWLKQILGELYEENKKLKKEQDEIIKEQEKNEDEKLEQKKD